MLIVLETSSSPPGFQEKVEEKGTERETGGKVKVGKSRTYRSSSRYPRSERRSGSGSGARKRDRLWFDAGVGGEALV